MRRIPRQRRSAATVEAIFDATAQLLDRDGIEAFNTNKIAELAGVSIGTLYQYFEDKNDILLGMARREAAKIRKIVARHIDNPGTSGLRAIVHSLVYAFEGRPGIRMALFNAHLDRRGRSTFLNYNRVLMDEISRQVGSRTKLPNEVVFILTRAVVGILRQVAIESRSFALDKLEDELVCLMESYISALKIRGELLPLGS
jgi:AcrR family transcriptional regulator